jgi:hypothetical protein
MKPSRTVFMTAAVAACVWLVAGAAEAGNTVSKGNLNAETGKLKKQLLLPTGNPVVRRHLQCGAIPQTQLPTVIITTIIPAQVVITNNWQMTIPSGTVFTYTIAGKSATYGSANALGPGEKLAFGPSVPVPAAGACIATIPG